MRLYCKPGACSLPSRIVLTELGLAHEAIKVDTEAGRTEAGQRGAHAALERRMGDADRGLSDGRSYVLGENFSVADAYRFVVLNWCNFISVDLQRWPHLAAFVERVASRPAVRAAMAREGLIKKAAA